MSQITPQQALDCLSLYLQGTYAEKLWDNENCAEEVFTGICIPVTDLRQLYANTDIKKIFVGIGAFEKITPYNFTIFIMGIEDFYTPTNDTPASVISYYNYGQKYPPKKTTGWPSALAGYDAAYIPTPPANTECEDPEKLIIVINDIITRSLYYNYNYQTDPTTNDRKYNHPFRGVLIDKSTIERVSRDKDVNYVNIFIGKENDTPTTTQYNLIFIGMKDMFEIHGQHFYKFSTPLSPSERENLEEWVYQIADENNKISKTS